ncbi:unnamed protein product [Vitrella brassicaformis CCMP3155]|uniref:Uncharacterized protein n=1 Tax=Vitrella brassicaformis (strain CCMP3155) TaxID=1169540 RepID=A0A0G4GU36_VITBC|nr:unnamed protein product [Vitrella brassicaformis CCMP3155]|eukprot:CEM34137.1 unnamed protein product [Vitrella brassicaformis CCMP3155]
MMPRIAHHVTSYSHVAYFRLIDTDEDAHRTAQPLTVHAGGGRQVGQTEACARDAVFAERQEAAGAECDGTFGVFGDRAAFMYEKEAVRQWTILSWGLTVGDQQMRLMDGDKLLLHHPFHHAHLPLPSCTIRPRPPPTQLRDWTYPQLHIVHGVLLGLARRPHPSGQVLDVFPSRLCCMSVWMHCWQPRPAMRHGGGRGRLCSTLAALLVLESAAMGEGNMAVIGGIAGQQLGDVVWRGRKR